MKYPQLLEATTIKELYELRETMLKDADKYCKERGSPQYFDELKQLHNINFYIKAIEARILRMEQNGATG